MLKNGNYSAHELQRIKVQLYSQFGVWTDSENTIEFKIYPSVGGAKIKIWSVHDLIAIKRISNFCGLNALPKRTNWQGFDLVTHLERKGNDSYVNGLVHMPNNKRKNLAEFKITEFNEACLNFFYLDPADFEAAPQPCGTIVLIQNKDLNTEEHQRSIP